METLMYFYFEAQTGRIHLKAPQAPSNFFRYTFDLKPLAKVKLLVEQAEVGSSGLVYPAGALAWLDANRIDRPNGLIPRPANVNG